jgi:hypothetical protein
VKVCIAPTHIREIVKLRRLPLLHPLPRPPPGGSTAAADVCHRGTLLPRFLSILGCSAGNPLRNSKSKPNPISELCGLDQIISDRNGTMDSIARSKWLDNNLPVLWPRRTTALESEKRIEERGGARPTSDSGVPIPKSPCRRSPSRRRRRSASPSTGRHGEE